VGFSAEQISRWLAERADIQVCKIIPAVDMPDATAVDMLFTCIAA
jgi:hypothetical protein